MLTPAHAPDENHEILARMIEIIAPGERDVVAFLEAYFDESYSDKDPRVLAVAGYVFEKDACLEFDREVKALLDHWDLPYFHMVECAHGSDKFKTLGTLERIEVATEMIALIRRFTLFGVAFAVNQDEYRSFFPEGYFPASLPLHDPYSYCCHTCLTAVQARLDRTGFQGNVGYFFEAGHDSAPKFQKLMDVVFRTHELKRGYRYSAHGFVPKTHRPVQAADMLAWFHYTDSKNQLSPKPRPKRKDFIALCEGMEIEAKIALRQHMQHMRAQVDTLFQGRQLLTGTWGNWSPFVAAWLD